MRQHRTIVGVVAILLLGWATQDAPSRQLPASPTLEGRACESGVRCCPEALAGFCRVGCPGPPPQVKSWVVPDLTSVARPYPSGVVILELGINKTGLAVSACVLRGVRSDFDEAVQAAALRSRWNSYLPHGKPVGLVMTTTVCTPDLNCNARPAR